MPIYEYQCAACGHHLEAMQKLSDAPLKDCPQCGAASLKKLISKSAFRLKGGGWYETDFKNAGRKKPGADDAKKSGGAEKSPAKTSAPKTGSA